MALEAIFGAGVPMGAVALLEKRGEKLPQAARSCLEPLQALEALFTLTCSPLGAGPPEGGGWAVG
eukprot:629205-Alexandrium_andersonii.AAC.1